MARGTIALTGLALVASVPVGVELGLRPITAFGIAAFILLAILAIRIALSETRRKARDEAGNDLTYGDWPSVPRGFGRG